MDLDQFRKDANRSQTENRKLYDKLKRKKPLALDETVHRLHDEAFEVTDCLQCANCCKTTSPIFYEKDIDRAAGSIGMKPGEFIEKYLHIDEDKDYVLNSAPCPFLGGDNYCSIYKDRPAACREYPHTKRKRMYQIMDLTYRNTLVCPAVLRITEELKKIY